MFINLTPVNKTDFNKLLVPLDKVMFYEKDGKCFVLNENGEELEIEEDFESLVGKLT